MVNIIKNKRYSGDFLKEQVILSNEKIIYNTISIVIVYIFFYIIYKLMSSYRIKIKNINIDNSYLLYTKFLILILILNYLDFFIRRSGVSGSISSDRIYYLLALFIPIKELVYIYYCIYRKKKTKIFWVPIFLFLILNFLRGWTIHFLILILLELFIKYEKIKFKNICTYALLSPFFLKGYHYLYNIKFYLRTGINYNFSFVDSILSLIDRFSFINSLCILLENIEHFNGENYDKILRFWYFKHSVLTIIPSPNLLGIHNYVPISRFLVNLLYPGVASDTVIGILGYEILYFKYQVLEFILFNIFIIFLIIVYKILIDMYAKKELNCLFFIVLMGYIQSGSINELIISIYGIGFSICLILLFNIKLKISLKEKVGA